jgi:two-component system response regulator DctR
MSAVPIPASSQPEAPDQRPWRVLVVEDSPSVGALHHRLVKATPGFRSLGVVTEGDSAYRAALSMRPDLAIVDLSMPGCDGLTFLRRLRAEALMVEVIVVTASRDARTVQEAVQLGVIDYLVKPFALERLQHALNVFAQRSRVLRRTQLAQDDVDLVQVSGGLRLHRLPKGLRRKTLSAIRGLLASSDIALSADEVGRAVGVARVTARRYLDYLDVVGAARVERESNGPGRPLNRYRHVVSVRAQAAPPQGRGAAPTA